MKRYTTWVPYIVAFFAFVALGLMSTNVVASEAGLLPFFSKPYPFGYTRARRDPDAGCWQYQQVQGLFSAYHVERVWVCSAPVVERY